MAPQDIGLLAVSAMLVAFGGIFTDRVWLAGTGLAAYFIIFMSASM